MDFIEEYNDLFDIAWHTDSSGNKISKKQTNEQHKIVGNIALLNEIPDQFYRVKITNMYELNKGSKINNANEFVVDYLTGRITFHESKDGATIMVDEYYGRGLIKGFAIRSLLMDKNDNWESDNLEDLAQEIKQYIDTNRTELNADIDSLQSQISSVEDNISDLAGEGRTTETVKDNSNKIGILNGIRVSVGTTQPTDTVFWLDTSS